MEAAIAYGGMDPNAGFRDPGVRARFYMEFNRAKAEGAAAPPGSENPHPRESRYWAHAGWNEGRGG